MPRALPSHALRPLWAVFCNEWRQHIYSPIVAIFLCAYALFLSAAIFLVGDFFSTDEASLRLFTVFLPWVSLVLVPALAMKSWGDENSDSSLALAFSLPIPVAQLVGGKFLAGSLVLMIALLCTLPFPLTIAYLGKPDVGALVAGYVAAALFLMGCFSLCLFAATMVRDQISAFVAGLTVLLVLMLLGWDVATKLSREALPSALESALVALSPKHWFERIATGQIELSAIVYFTLAIAAALWATGWAIQRRRTGHPKSQSLILSLIGGLTIAVSLPVLLSAIQYLPVSLDLTEQKEFTVHPNMDQVIQNLPAGTTVDLYWSQSQSSVPLSIKSHARRALNRLRVLERRSSGRLSVNLIDPRPDSDEELNALAQGIQRIPMTSGDFFYLGATASVGERLGKVSYLDVRRQQLLDYDLAVLLSELGRKSTRKLGILSPLFAPSHMDQGRPGLTVLEELKRSFDVAIIPHFSETLPEDLDAVLIVDATILKKEMLYSIDQFAMKGGGLVILMDPHLRSNEASNAVNPDPTDKEINDLSDLLLRYGVVYQGKTIIGDKKHAASVMDGAQRQTSYPFWLRLPRTRLSAAHPVTANLNEILLVEPGSLNIPTGSSFEPIVSSSDASGGLKRNLFRKQTPAQLSNEFEANLGPQVLLAVNTSLLKSAFSEAPNGAKKHVEIAQRLSPLFVGADVDWLFDPFSIQQSQASGQLLARPLNDNWALLVNMLEFSAGDPTLVAIRSRGRLDRPFTRIATMFREAQDLYREREAELSGRIANVETEISKIPEAAGVTQIDQLPPELQERITNIRQGLLPLRKELRALRLTMREKIEALRLRLITINLLAAPLLVLLFTLIAHGLRNRWRVRSSNRPDQVYTPDNHSNK